MGLISRVSSRTYRNMNCVFCKIISGELPSKIVADYENILVFNDHRPAAQTHLLAIPKLCVRDMSCLSKDEIEKLKEKLLECAEKLNLDPAHSLIGYHTPRFVSVAHAHLHLINRKEDMGFISRMIFKTGTWWFKEF